MSKSLKLKTELIKTFINDFYDGIKTKPRMWGTTEQIEYVFYYMDYIDLIMTYGDIDYKELSWRTFLLDKGDYGPRSATQEILQKKSVNPDKELIKLREEYLKWRDKKIQVMSMK